MTIELGANTLDLGNNKLLVNTANTSAGVEYAINGSGKVTGDAYYTLGVSTCSSDGTSMVVPAVTVGSGVTIENTAAATATSATPVIVVFDGQAIDAIGATPGAVNLSGIAGTLTETNTTANSGIGFEFQNLSANKARGLISGATVYFGNTSATAATDFDDETVDSVKVTLPSATMAARVFAGSASGATTAALDGTDDALTTPITLATVGNIAADDDNTTGLVIVK